MAVWGFSFWDLGGLITPPPPLPSLPFYPSPIPVTGHKQSTACRHTQPAGVPAPALCRCVVGWTAAVGGALQRVARGTEGTPNRVVIPGGHSAKSQLPLGWPLGEVATGAPPRGHATAAAAAAAAGRVRVHRERPRPEPCRLPCRRPGRARVAPPAPRRRAAPERAVRPRHLPARAETQREGAGILEQRRNGGARAQRGMSSQEHWL